MLTLLLAFCALALLAILFWLTDAGRRALRRRWRAWRQRPHRFRVVQRIEHDETHYSLRLAPLRGRCRSFIAGQYLTVLGPLLPAGNHAERRYSLDHWEGTPTRYGLTIKKEPMGRVSGWLHETIREGDELKCRLPEGDFILPDMNDQMPIVLVAAGVGITPLRAMIHALHARGHGGRITLFFTARSRSGLIYHQEFEHLASEWPSFDYCPRLTGHDDQWSGETGRFTASDLVAHDNGSTHYLFCTSHAMIEALSEGLRDLCVPRSRIHYELFASSAGLCGNFTMTVGEAEFPVEGYPNLLAAMETHAVAAVSDCRAGHCGLCRRRLASGNVEHGPGLACALGAGEFLPCIAVPTSDIRVAA